MEDKLYIDYKYVNDASVIITTASSNIGENITSINKILDSSIKENWEGSDSSSYILNLKNVMSTLEKYNSELKRIGEYFESVSIDYEEKVATCIKEIAGNE